jgi:xylulokinase
VTLVAGVDSSTQSCKLVVCDAATGEVLRSGSAPHPGGTEVDPAAWWQALERAIAAAGGLSDVAAVSVGGQQHGMVLLDAAGEVVRPALLWNDTRSADAARDLTDELEFEGLRGEAAWLRAVGSVPVASYTVTKLRWMADYEPENLARAVVCCLPHDWLSFKLRGLLSATEMDLNELATDRSDASGTGYFAASRSRYLPEILELATRGQSLMLPRVIGPFELVSGVAAGMGDNAAAAMGLGANHGDVVVSVGTSGVVSAVSDSGVNLNPVISGFADGTGGFLPLACTLNGAMIFDRYASLFGVSLAELGELALAAKPGAGGIVTLPYFAGERTPNLPAATARIVGLNNENFSRENLARSAFEGLLCGLADAMAAVSQAAPKRVLLIGGASKNPALRQIAAEVFGCSVEVPAAREYVALGAARQAAGAVLGELPSWPRVIEQTLAANPQPRVREQYAAAREAYLIEMGL